MGLLVSEEPRYHFSKPQRDLSRYVELINLAKRNDAYICGGFARYIASNTKNPIPPSDIDIFCRSEASFISVRTELSDKYKCKIIDSKFAVNFILTRELGYTVQLIKPIDNGLIRSFGKVYDILDTFDFSVSRACIVSEKAILVHKNFHRDEMDKLLKIVAPLHNPFRILLRSCKYMTKGYELPPVEMIRLLMAWENYSDEYKEKLMGTFNKIGKEGRNDFPFGRAIPVSSGMDKGEISDMYELFWGAPM